MGHTATAMDHLDRDIIRWIIDMKGPVNGPHASLTQLLLNTIALANPLAREFKYGVAQ
jgi:hypothetical protein